MEENITDINEIAEENAGFDAPVKRVQYTKRQSITYTLLSVALFFLIYFAVKGITAMVNRPYKMSAYGEQISAERVGETFEMSGISSESGYEIENIHLYKDPQGYYFTALFSCDEIKENEEDYGYTSHAEEVLTFDLGDPQTDIRIEFSPYEDVPYEAEYAYGEKYDIIDELTASVSFFEWEDRQYALYEEYGYNVPAEVKSLFSGAEKVF